MIVKRVDELVGSVGSRWRRSGRRRLRPGEARAHRAAALLSGSMTLSFEDRYTPYPVELVTSWRHVMRHRRRMRREWLPGPLGGPAWRSRDVYGRVFGK